MFKYEDIAIIAALTQETQERFEKAGLKVHYCGIGKVNAAIATMQVIRETGCKRVLNIGTAGSHKFKPHELVECSAFVQRDMDLTPLGFARGETPYDSLGGRIDVATFLQDLPKGICGTGDAFEVGVPKLECDLVDMEGYAMAKACVSENVAFTSIKYITDGSDSEAHQDWTSNLVHAAESLFALFQRVVR